MISKRLLSHLIATAFICCYNNILAQNLPSVSIKSSLQVELVWLLQVGLVVDSSKIEPCHNTSYNMVYSYVDSTDKYSNQSFYWKFEGMMLSGSMFLHGVCFKYSVLNSMDTVLVYSVKVNLNEIEEVRRYYKGKLVESFTVKADRNHGYYESKKMDGTVTLSGFYDKGRRIGSWYEVDYYGEVSTGSYYPSYVRVKYSGDYFVEPILVEDDSLRILAKGFSNDSVFFKSLFEKYNIIDIMGLPKVYFMKDGIWNYHSRNGVLTKVEYYEKGKLLRTETK